MRKLASGPLPSGGPPHRCRSQNVGGTTIIFVSGNVGGTSIIFAVGSRSSPAMQRYGRGYGPRWKCRRHLYHLRSWFTYNLHLQCNDVAEAMVRATATTMPSPSSVSHSSWDRLLPPRHRAWAKEVWLQPPGMTVACMAWPGS